MKIITQKILPLLLLCAVLLSSVIIPIAADTTCAHELADGKCATCGETAKQVTVADGVTVYTEGGKTLTPVDGIYYLFMGDVVFLKCEKIPAGKYFDGWNLTSAGSDHQLAGNRLVIGSADIAIAPTLTANRKVKVVINAPLFTVTGLSGMQFGAATVSPVAGTTLTVSYTGAAFMPGSSVVYWVNESGMIVGMGDSITFTASTSTTITAICNQGTAGTALILYRNGPDRIGTKVLNYVSASAGDLSNLSLHANASVGTLNVVGWKITGTDSVLTKENFLAAAEASIASGEILYLEPAIAKHTVNIEIKTGQVGSTDYTTHHTEQVYADEYAFIKAPSVEGRYFSHWLVGDATIIANKTLVYKFDSAATVYAIYSDTPVEGTAAPSLRLDADAPTGEGKIYLNGIYQIPEGCTLTDAGILYTTDSTIGNGSDFDLDTSDVKIRKVSGLEDKVNTTYSLTLKTSKDELTVWVKAFMTFIDADNRVVTIYTDVECVYYSSSIAEVSPSPEVVMLPEQEVRVAGINIYAGQNDLAVRSELLADLLNPLSLDSFGVSECKGQWETELETQFGDRYARVGLDCNGKHNATNFATYIFYLKDKYIAIDTGTFWMSKTPDVPSKYGSTVDMNRTCTWVLLENIETGFRYVHMNCHLDHKDTAVNKIQCQMIVEQIKRFEAMGYPVFATGDYNMREYNDSYPTMTAAVNDARYIATETTDMLTHPESGTIDYCFVTKGTTEVYKFDVLDTQTEPIEISDHRGVYVHAKVKSLPKQDSYISTMPSFAEGTKIEALISGFTSGSITVDQALDAYGSAPRFYLLEVFDRNGKLLSSEQLSSGYHLPEQPAELTQALTFPTTNEKYRISLTPIGLFGQYGEPLVQWVTCEWEPPKPSAPIAPAAPDVIDIDVVNGEIKDVSANAHALEALGTVMVTEDRYSFTNNGNIKFADFKNYYSTLADGFSVVTSIRTSEDVTTQQCFLGNQHAGGFGLQIKDGKLNFSVHLNGSYVTVSATV